MFCASDREKKTGFVKEILFISSVTYRKFFFSLFSFSECSDENVRWLFFSLWWIKRLSLCRREGSPPSLLLFIYFFFYPTTWWATMSCGLYWYKKTSSGTQTCVCFHRLSVRLETRSTTHTDTHTKDEIRLIGSLSERQTQEGEPLHHRGKEKSLYSFDVAPFFLCVCRKEVIDHIEHF